MKPIYTISILISLLAFNGLDAQEITENAPLNSDFENYLENKNHKITDSKLGYIPMPFLPNFDYLKKEEPTVNLKSTPLPTRYDLREQGYLTSIKNQGGTFGGNCWCFTTMGAIESQWMKAGYDSINLSEQHLANCHGFDWGYGEGGNDFLALAYLTRFKGPLLESQDAYQPNDPQYWQCKDSVSPYAFVPEVRWLPNDRNEIKKALYKFGGLSVSMTWNNSSFDNATNSFLYSGNNAVNHAIMLVGWDDDKVIPGGKGAWICRNQWSSNWGEQGYFYISYNDSKINSTASYYPIRIERSNIDKIYYHDKLGAVRFTGFRNEKAYALTRFIANGIERIPQIGLFVASASSIIDIEIYDTKNGNVLSDLRASIKNATCDLPGFYVFDEFDQIAQVTDDFYVKVKFFTPGYLYPIPIETKILDYATPDINVGDGVKPNSISYPFFILDKPSIKNTYPNLSEKIGKNQAFQIQFSSQIKQTNKSSISLKDSIGNIIIIDSIIFNEKNDLLSIFSSNKQHGMRYYFTIADSSFLNYRNDFNDSIRLSLYSDTNVSYITNILDLKYSYINNIDTLKFITNSKINSINPNNLLILSTKLKSPLGYTSKIQTDSLSFSLYLSNITESDTLTLQFKDSTITTEINGYNNKFELKYIANGGKPKAIKYIPTDKAINSSTKNSFFVEFNQPIDSNKFSNIRIQNSKFVDQFAVTKCIFHKDFNAIEIQHKALANDQQYYIVIPDSAVKNSFKKYNSIFYWTIYTAKIGIPVIDSLYPSPYSSIFKNTDTAKFYLNTKLTINNKKYLTINSAFERHPSTISQSNNLINAVFDSLTSNNYNTLNLKDSLLTFEGFNWISSNGNQWSPAGLGIKANEYDISIKAYSDTNNNLKALFTTSKKIACTGTTITFNNKSIGIWDTAYWDFGIGATPKTAIGNGPHQVVYTSIGLKNIELIISNNLISDSLKKSNYIEITDSINLYTLNPSVEIGTKDSILVEVFGADEYTWFPTTGLDTNKGNIIKINPIKTGTLTYYYYGKQGNCNAYDSIILTIIDRPINDNACNAIQLNYGVNGPFTNKNASVESNEPNPPNNDCNTQASWCFEFNSEILKNSVWFKFDAIASNNISLSSADPNNNNVEMDNQIAIYEAESCENLFDNTSKMLYANDDFYDETRSYAAAISQMKNLIIGKTYWVQVDGSNAGAEGNFYLILDNKIISTINHSQKESGFMFYPNPASNYITIENSNESLYYTINIINTEGITIKSCILEGKEKNILSISNLVKGVYYIQCIDAEKSIIRKLIVP